MKQSRHILRTDREHAVVLQLVGEFDMARVDEMQAAIAAALEDSARLVIDLTQTDFLDSVCLGALVGARRRALGSGGWVRLVASSASILKVLEITGLDEVFGVFPDVQQADAHAEQSAGKGAGAPSLAPSSS